MFTVKCFKDVNWAYQRRSRYYTFTIYDTGPDDVPNVFDFSYIIFGLENNPLLSTDFIVGFCVTKKRMTRAEVRVLLPRASISDMIHGQTMQCIDYVRQQIPANFVMEHGREFFAPRSKPASFLKRKREEYLDERRIKRAKWSRSLKEQTNYPRLALPHVPGSDLVLNRYTVNGTWFKGWQELDCNNCQ